MIRALGPVPPVIIEAPSTPAERAAALDERERYLRNARWFAARADEIGRTHVGRFVCVAGEELFLGDVPEQVLAEARTKHPHESGAVFYKYVSRHRGPKVYATRRVLADR